MSFSTAISGVFLPRLSAMIAKHCSDREVSNLFIRTGRIQYIVLAFLLSGFILFGRQFILLWAGPDYGEAFPIALLFFVALTVPLIQNVGISILQARNEMKFRSLLYIAIALVSLAAQVVAARFWGGIGCAIAISGALFLGQGLIMNIYYRRRQRLDIGAFWREIAKMSVAPLLLTAGGWLAVSHLRPAGIAELAIAIAVYSAIYIPLFWFTSMNDYERDLLKRPAMRMLKTLLR